MSSAPIVVHRPSRTGGRRVTVHTRGRDEILGTAYSDHDLVVFLDGAGITDPETILDDPRWIEWRDGPAHEYHAT
ncbi:MULTISPECIES: hypothetical protein [Streptomyces]|uniref:Uncharacterized protein n=1 Tax=Streptomyces doudnae TaxID=3075536 RepID=A0ABD5ELD4_9ACTN|nr:MULTISPECIES: hypothetical protein [unclassified Streptomyces]MDT0435433.1 hypothetical protein [Streptomyces sp. DSM 41981]MYQ62357.1 hypothetical protein [Streptomyces sp. SID4950]